MAACSARSPARIFSASRNSRASLGLSTGFNLASSGTGPAPLRFLRAMTLRLLSNPALQEVPESTGPFVPPDSQPR
jgi:hypothetical protein